MSTVVYLVLDPAGFVSRPQIMAELFALEELAMELGHAPSYERMEAVRLQRRAVMLQVDFLFRTIEQISHQQGMANRGMPIIVAGPGPLTS